MGRFFPEIRLVLFVFLFLSGLHAASLLYGAELPGLEFAPGENQQEQNQEITQEILKIKVDVAQVTVDVTVTGTPVSELRLEDFTVYDNGVAQNVSQFSRDKIPLAVALLIDRSGSEIPYLPALKIAALSALRRLRPEDQVALFSFDANPAKLSNLTEDRLKIGKNINALTVNNRSGTNIFDTIYDAARYLAKNAPNRRRAIILVSDNCQTVSGKHDADDAQVEMLEASATLYGIKTAGDVCLESRDQVKWIASETGGEILDVSAPTSLQAALEKTTSNLRLQYTLSFSPSNLGEEGSFHKLTVKFAAKDRCPGCQLLARSGYYAGITAPLFPQDDIPLKLNVSAETTDQLLVQRLILTAGTTELDLTDIPFTVQTFEQTDSMDRPQLKIDLQIDFSRIELTIVKDRRPCKLYVVVFYADENGKILGSNWKKIEGLLSEEAYDQIRERGILVSTTVPIEAKKQILKVVVYDEENDRVGSKLVKLDNKANRTSSATARQISEEKKYSAHDLDELMAKVWQNCKLDLDNLRGYIFNEKDTLYGKNFSPGSDSRTRVEDSLYYVWTANNGYLGPSLKKINGKEVTVNWKKLKITKKGFSLVWDPNTVKWYVNQRQNHQKWERWDTLLDIFDDLVEGWSGHRIYERFDYKPRKYSYVGTREYEGHRVIEITYPSNANIGSGTTLVTMLVIPDENQLAAVRLSLQQSHSQADWTMTMDNSHDNVWLPKEFRQLGTSSWGGVVKVTREFDSYVKTDVKAKFWFEDVQTRIIYLETPEPKK